MTGNKYRILIVDDHPMVRAGLQSLIGSEPDLDVCGEAEDVAGALSLTERERPDLVIIDLSLADGSGLDLVSRIKHRDPDIKMLVASMYDESLYAERALSAGALGYINKQEAPTKMIEAIRRVLDNRIYLSEFMSEHLLHSMVNSRKGTEFLSTVELLSNRELAVFDLIGKGVASGEIARQLNLSIKTIETHQASIKRKLGLKSAMELNRKAMLWYLEKT